jgi:guanylate kinase
MCLFIAPLSWRFCRNASVNAWHLESTESFQQRTEKAKAEVKYGLAAGNFDLIVINNNLDKACMYFDAAIKILYNGDCH